MKVALKKSDVGKFCLVSWDDIGRMDCLIVEVNDRMSCKVFCFGDEVLRDIESNQILEIGKRCVPPIPNPIPNFPRIDLDWKKFSKSSFYKINKQLSERKRGTVERETNF